MNSSNFRRVLYLYAFLGLLFFCYLFISTYYSPSNEIALERAVMERPGGRHSSDATPPARRMPSPASLPTPLASNSTQNSRVHVFYYPWYGNIATDGAWNHWDHNIIPHWDAKVREQFKHDVRYVPPDDIGACFYPKLGPYSSADEALLDEHMKTLKNYVVVVSWWGQAGKKGSSDSQGATTDALMPKIFRAAEKHGALIAVHLEPYEGRTHLTVKDDIRYLVDTYGHSPAFYRESKSQKPVVYIYDSYHTLPMDWRSILDANSPHSIRNTPYDALLLGLYVNHDSGPGLRDSHFDGFYTYFAAEGFTEGSTSMQWPKLMQFARSNGLLVSLSVGPGYDDRRVRPWNARNTKSRLGGRYYDSHWQQAINMQPEFISITSFNEWMEGTQIEAAVPKSIASTTYDGRAYTYENYLPLSEDHYIAQTHDWAQKFREEGR